jgi:hypothetical protein
LIATGFILEKLGFSLVADEYQPEQDKRWVLVEPPGAGTNAATLLLAGAAPAVAPVAGTW